MPQEQMPDEIYLIPDNQGGSLLIVSKYDSPGRVKYVPASKPSALAERLERAEALLKECVAKKGMDGAYPGGCSCGLCNEWRELISRISSFLHDGTKGEKP